MVPLHFEENRVGISSYIQCNTELFEILSISESLPGIDQVNWELYP